VDLPKHLLKFFLFLSTPIGRLVGKGISLFYNNKTEIYSEPRYFAMKNFHRILFSRLISMVLNVSDGVKTPVLKNNSGLV